MWFILVRQDSLGHVGNESGPTAQRISEVSDMVEQSSPNTNAFKLNPLTFDIMEILHSQWPKFLSQQLKRTFNVDEIFVTSSIGFLVLGFTLVDI